MDVDKLMGIQQIRAKNKGAAENGNSAENKTIRPLKAGSSTNFTSDGATKQAAIMHHEERSMPSKVAIVPQRDLKDIPHRNNANKVLSSKPRNEFI